MGLDLTLVPYDWNQPMDWFLAYTRIRLDGGARGLYEQLEEADLLGHPLPPGVRFQWYGDEGLKTYTEDPYGSVLRYVLAGDLAKIDPRRDRWKAAWAYLNALPPDTPVVLWWH